MTEYDEVKRRLVLLVRDVYLLLDDSVSAGGNSDRHVPETTCRRLEEHLDWFSDLPHEQEGYTSGPGNKVRMALGVEDDL